jgi:hypothetical protein
VLLTNREQPCFLTSSCAVGINFLPLQYMSRIGVSSIHGEVAPQMCWCTVTWRSRWHGGWTAMHTSPAVMMRPAAATARM